MLNRLALLMALWLARPVYGQQIGYVVVVNQANPVSSLTRTEVSNLFLRKVTKWSDGSAVHPVDLPNNSPVRAAFSREVHGKSVASISAFWQQQIFSGRDVPPSEKAEAELIVYLRNEPGAIGYLPAGPPPPGLKLIQVLP
jgi:ABC-type phosphate transport system substrate-binding protein